MCVERGVKVVSHRIAAVVILTQDIRTSRRIVHDLIDLLQCSTFFQVCEVLWNVILIDLGVSLAIETVGKAVCEAAGALQDGDVSLRLPEPLRQLNFHLGNAALSS